MIIPEIMPGELALGYFFRFRDINAYKMDANAIKALRARFETAGEESLPLMLLLSRAVDMSLQQFSRFHTLLPFSRAVTGYLPELPHGDTNELRPILCHGMGQIKKIYESIKACACCVAEDIDYWGYAYYRREHQLVGVSFCNKHLTLLSETSRFLPLSLDNIRPIKSASQSPIVTSDSNNEIIKRYFTIVESWSMAERPIPVLKIVSVLQARARALGLRWSNNGNKPLLSDLALQVCPGWWIQTIAPNILNKRPNRRLPSLDGVLVQQARAFKSSAYALALSLLFDNAEEALNASYGCIEAKPRVITKFSKQESTIFDGRDFTNTYINHKGNSKTIAKVMGLQVLQLRKMMKNTGLPPLAGYRQNELQAFMDFQNGMSFMEACIKNDATPLKFEILLRSSGRRLADALKSFKNTENNSLPEHALFPPKLVINSNSIQPEQSLKVERFENAQ